jgi:hypothetical protein
LENGMIACKSANLHAQFGSRAEAFSVNIAYILGILDFWDARIHTSRQSANGLGSQCLLKSRAHLLNVEQRPRKRGMRGLVGNVGTTGSVGRTMVGTVTVGSEGSETRARPVASAEEKEEEAAIIIIAAVNTEKDLRM